LVSCDLGANKEVIKGQALLANLCNYVDSRDVRGCANPQFICTATPNNSNGNVGSEITIRMGVTCSEGAPANGGNANVDCTNRVRVVAEKDATISCAWGNGPSDYSIGQKPKVIATVVNGSVTTCNANPTITASNFTGIGTTNWTRTGTASGATDATAAHTFDATPALTAVQTNRSVTVSVNCTGGANPGTKTAVCPNKNVVNKPTCTYDPSWCNNDSRYAKANNVPASAPNAGNACFFVTNITEFCSNGGNSKINGVNVGQGGIGCWGSNGTVPPARDGGYYIWVDNGVGVWAGTAGTSPTATCDVPPDLACTWTPATNPQIGKFVSNSNQVEGGAIPAPTVICGTNTITTGINWTNSQTPWGATVAPGNYTVAATTNCNGQKTANCGSLLVRYAPSVNTCNFTNATGSAGSSLTKPTISLTDASNICSNANSNAPNGSWTGEAWSYTTPPGGNNFNWASLPTSATYPTQYTGFKVSGTCGQYGTVTSGNCGGTVTVTAAVVPPCQYQSSWCGGIALNNVVVVNGNVDYNDANARCVFIKGVNGYLNTNNAARIVNGNSVDGLHYSNAALNNLPKVDGGYYISLPAWTFLGINNAVTGNPECQGFGQTPSSSSVAQSSNSGGGGVTITGGTDLNIGAGTTVVTCSDNSNQIICSPNGACTVNWTFTANGQTKTIQSWQCPGPNYQGMDMPCNGGPYTIVVPTGRALICQKNW
jgi:hypothetical protein